MDPELFFVKQSLLEMQSTFQKHIDMMTFCLDLHITSCKQQMAKFQQESDEHFAKLAKQIHEIEDKVPSVYPMDFVQASYGTVEKTEQQQEQQFDAPDRKQHQPPHVSAMAGSSLAHKPVAHGSTSDEQQEAQENGAGQSMKAKPHQKPYGCTIRHIVHEPEACGSISVMPSSAMVLIPAAYGLTADMQQEAQETSAGQSMEAKLNEKLHECTVRRIPPSGACGSILDGQQKKQRLSADKLMAEKEDLNTDNFTIQDFQSRDTLGLRRLPFQEAGPSDAKDARAAYMSPNPYSHMAKKNTSGGSRSARRNRKKQIPMKHTAN